MISRLTAIATLFAVIATASIGVAASAQQNAVKAEPVAAKQVRTVQLQTVVVVAKRTV